MTRHFIIVLVLGAVTARAGADTRPKRCQEADRVGADGNKDFEKGQFEAALKKFEIAGAVCKETAYLQLRGKVLASLERWLEAADVLEEYIKNPDSTEDPLRKQRAEQLLAVVEQHIGILVITVNEPDAHILIDEALAGMAPQVTKRVSAAQHRVASYKAGFLTVERAVTVEAGQRVTVALELTPPLPPDAGSVTVVDAGAPDATVEPEDDFQVPLAPKLPMVREPWYRDTWGLVITGLGTAVAGVGVGLLISASSLDDQAKNEADPFKANRTFDAADSRRTFGTLVLIVGGGAMAAGIIKLMVPNWSQPHYADAPKTRAHTEKLRLEVGIGWIGVRGIW